VPGDWITGLLQARREQRPWAVHPAQLQCALDEAYAMQAEHLRGLLDETDDSVLGAKLSVTSAPALQRLGLRAPLLGPILRGHAHASGVSLPRGKFLACILEAEIGVLLGADLDARAAPITRSAVADAVAAVFPALEIADSRYAQWAEAPASAIVADLAYAGDWVRGTDCGDWRALDLPTLAVTLSRNGAVLREGHGSAVLGDPLSALALAANEAGARGEVLRAGSVVSTGACTAPCPVSGSGRFVADFGALGTVELTLA
jgi:2-keto-4-pentenoate hydratase